MILQDRKFLYEAKDINGHIIIGRVSSPAQIVNGKEELTNFKQLIDVFHYDVTRFIDTIVFTDSIRSYTQEKQTEQMQDLEELKEVVEMGL